MVVTATIVLFISFFIMLFAGVPISAGIGIASVIAACVSGVTTLDGFAFTAGEMDEAIKGLSALTQDLLRLAEVEKTCSMLAAEIEKTRRRVNALEHVMIPDYEDTIRFITMKLDENERSTITRLMKVKDMMLQR